MGIEVKDWSDARTRVSRQMFIFDIIREYNQFISKSTVTWLTSPAEKRSEHLKAFEEAMDDYRDATMYSVHIGQAKKKKEDSEDSILERVANLNEDITEL